MVCGFVLKSRRCLEEVVPYVQQLVHAQVSVESGSLTWMNMASLMVLERLLTSLCTMLNWSGSMGCPVVALWWCMGEGALKCSLTLSPKRSA